MFNLMFLPLTDKLRCCVTKCSL